MRLIIFLVITLTLKSSFCQLTEEEAFEYLKELDQSLSSSCNANILATWDYVTDVTNSTAQEEASRASVEYLSFRGEVAQNVSLIDFQNFSVELYRQFRFLADKGPGGLPSEKLERYEELQSGMEDIYNEARLCSYENADNCSLQLEPDLEYIMATSTNWDELEFYWNQWREKTGNLMRDSFLEFAQLSNDAATIDGYSDTGDYWLNGYTVTQKEADDYSSLIHTLDEITADKFREIISSVWQEVSTKLYKKVHAFVRMRLKETLYKDQIDSTGPLPAHVLGNMWAQDWTNIAQYVMPFSDQPTFDVTDSMIQNNWNIDQMFEAAEDFFTSIGLFEMTEDFKTKTVNNQTKHGKAMECHASAEDFCLGANNTDFRIKMCTEVNMEDLVTVHHEMGHIEYFMAYRNLYFPFREAANPGFHEAIGDLIALSVSTPQHLEDVLGLTPSSAEDGPDSDISLRQYSSTEKNDINFLMTMALQKIAFLPFGYLVDQYRWGVFNGSITNDNLNEEWWRLRTELQGISPPSGTRGEEYFDAGAKFHIPANVPYIRYFVAFIVQFQFHQRLCASIGQENPLHKCDIYGHEAAGTILRNALERGFSDPWPLVLQDLGGSYTMEASSIISYFQPLIDYLDTELENECIGWGDECARVDNEAEENLERMEQNMIGFTREAVQTAWNFNLNTRNTNRNAMIEAKTAFDMKYKENWEKYIQNYDTSEISDDTTLRQYTIQASIGQSILNDTEELNSLMAQMKEVYSNKICSYSSECESTSDDTLTVADVNSIMASETDYSELSYYWAKWRAITGQAIAPQFAKVVDILNEAAAANGFKHAGEMMLQPYTRDDTSVDDLMSLGMDLWNQTFPLYQKLHAFVRNQLEQDDDYTDRINDDNHLLPANMMGDLWAYSWENIYHKVKPYPAETIPEITGALKSYANSTYMFETAEKFYHDIALRDMTDDFWKNSVRETPEKGDSVCIPRNWDFYSQSLDKFRISMCSKLTQEDFLTIHKQMGELESSMAYYEQPLVFRRPANPALPKAVGGAISLSTSTPSHLQSIRKDLDSSYVVQPELSEEQQINFLFKQALALIPPITFAFAAEQWKWGVYTGEILPGTYNEDWWRYRIDMQGIKPPIARQPSEDFDIASDFRIGNNIPLIEDFFSSFMQFQFHEKMCKLKGYDGEIFLCDINDTKMVGYQLNEMLKQGSSTSWESQLEGFLGTSEISADSMIRYFEKLTKFLDDQISENNIEVGWDPSKETLSDFMQESEEISAAVPIVVGIVFAIMVVVVIVAFLMGQRRNKKKEEEKKATTNGRSSLEMTENMDINYKIPRVRSVNDQNGTHDDGKFVDVILGDGEIQSKDGRPGSILDSETGIEHRSDVTHGTDNAAFSTSDEGGERL